MRRRTVSGGNGEERSHFASLGPHTLTLAYIMKTWLLILPALAFTACATSSFPKASTPKADYLKLEDQEFVSPSDGMIFRLKLGDRLYQNTGGITELPKGISGFRGATASYYSIEDKNGCGYGDAESSVSLGLEHYLKHIKIQHEPSSGRILVTEDTSDALPSMRYILFTPTKSGYSVYYLAPDYDNNLEEQGFPSSPPAVILLPEDRAWINGDIIPIYKVRKSKHPFNLGG